jgi:hypothetical protein
MVNSVLTNCRNVNRFWARTLTSMVWGVWRVLDTQYQVGIQILDTASGTPTEAGSPSGEDAGASSATAPGGSEGLEQRAAERMRSGMPPPREIYEVQNRGRIDWSAFPDWARPVDPDLFEGSAHEG